MFFDGSHGNREILTDLRGDFRNGGHDADKVGERQLDDGDAVFLQVLEVGQQGGHAILVEVVVVGGPFGVVIAVLALVELRLVFTVRKLLQQLGHLLDRVVGRHLLAIVHGLGLFQQLAGAQIAGAQLLGLLFTLGHAVE